MSDKNKNWILAIAITLAFISSSAFAGTMLGIDFDKPINKQMAGDHFTTWVDGGIKIAEPYRGVHYIEISVAGFDSNGDTFATGDFYVRSHMIPDEANCHKASLF